MRKSRILLASLVVLGLTGTANGYLSEAFLNACGKPAKPLTAGRNRMTINLGK